ncbi:MAG: mannitol dehydrogenase family protein [Candidatus Nanopelagicaceae bacterium]
MNEQVKIVHLGLGAFFKAHAAWYTHKCSDWKIVAFTGRSSKAADELAENNFKYKLVTKSIDGDVEEIIDNVVEAYDGNNIGALTQYICSPNVSIITLTITEAGYTAEANGTISKLLNALEKRFERNGKPISIVPCDNLTQNGAKVRALFNQLSISKSEAFRKYLNERVSIVSTSVDRITPKSDLPNTVITESYSAWVLQGDFPAGRPNWELAGAKFVEDIKPYENRKLWLLNGAHSLLAYMGINRGYLSVSEAIRDAAILEKVVEFWQEASDLLDNPSLDLSSYQDALIARFSNPNIGHQLQQIATDGSMKLRERIVPIIKGRMARGSATVGCKFVISQWIEYLSNHPYNDVNSIQIEAALNSENPTRALVAILDNELAANENYLNSIPATQTIGKNHHAKTTN